MSLDFNCANCNSRACLRGGAYPVGCPSVIEKQAVDLAIDRVADDENNRRIMAAADTASNNKNGALNNRVEALIQFCKTMDYTTIGVAFCVALAKEAQALCDLLSDADFTVVPVCCKVGGSSLADMGVAAVGNKGVACNPVAQAYVLNARNTDINIAVGLCLGHDILFSQNSRSPVTTLVVKDRVYKHNTVQALKRNTPAVAV